MSTSAQAGTGLLLAPKGPVEGPGLSGQCSWDESDGGSRHLAKGLGPTVSEVPGMLQVWEPVLRSLCL